MIKAILWLGWLAASITALGWSLSIGIEHDSWGRFWALLALCVGAAGWLGGYDRARVVGLLSGFGALATVIWIGDDQTLPLVMWDSFDSWPVVAALAWVLPVLYVWRNIEDWFFEAGGLVVMAAAFILYWLIGARIILLGAEIGILIVLAHSIGGGLGHIRDFMRGSRRGYSHRRGVASVAMQASLPRDNKKMD